MIYIHTIWQSCELTLKKKHDSSYKSLAFPMKMPFRHSCQDCQAKEERTAWQLFQPTLTWAFQVSDYFLMVRYPVSVTVKYLEVFFIVPSLLLLCLYTSYMIVFSKVLSQVSWDSLDTLYPLGCTWTLKAQNIPAVGLCSEVQASISQPLPLIFAVYELHLFWNSFVLLSLCLDGHLLFHWPFLNLGLTRPASVVQCLPLGYHFLLVAPDFIPEPADESLPLCAFVQF